MKPSQDEMEEFASRLRQFKSHWEWEAEVMEDTLLVTERYCGRDGHMGKPEARYKVTVEKLPLED